MAFRVKEVPNPIATIAGKNSGNIKKEELLAEDGIFPELKDFDFDLKFKITQFDLTISGSDGYANLYKSTNNKFTAEQKNQLKKLAVGSFFYIDNIMAKGDDGTNRQLAPISFKIR